MRAYDLVCDQDIGVGGGVVKNVFDLEVFTDLLRLVKDKIRFFQILIHRFFFFFFYKYIRVE